MRLRSRSAHGLLLAFFSLSSLIANGQEQKVHLAGLEVHLWPPSGHSRKSPVVIYSHGYLGKGDSSRSLLQALARAGYWVIAPDHQDRPSYTPTGQPIRFSTPNLWTPTTGLYRKDELCRLIAALPGAHLPHLDLQRIALVGHSLGGYSALCLAGARPNWALGGHNLKAVLALSPYLRPLLSQRRLAGVSIPVMIESGSLDVSARPYVRNPGGAYDQLSSPKLYVEISGARHDSWTNQDHDRARHALINRYAVAFLDHYLKGKPPDPILAHPAPGVTELRTFTSLHFNGAVHPKSTEWIDLSCSEPDAGDAAPPVPCAHAPA